MSAKKEHNKQHLKKPDAGLELFNGCTYLLSLPFLPPPFFSVVVLYTQGVESKQWREVRDHCLLSVNKTLSDKHTLTIQPLARTFPPLLSLTVKAMSANHLQLIDPANICVMVTTVLAVTDETGRLR